MATNTKGTQWTYQAREAVGVFRDATSLESAIDALENDGFDRASISVLATDPHSGQKLEAFYKTAKDIEDNGHVPQTAFISTDERTEGEALAVAAPFYVGGVAGAVAVTAVGGALALAFAAALVTGTAAAGVGALLAGAIARHHAAHVEEQLKKGGLVLWVGVANAEAEKQALAILQEAGAEDIHVHEVEREWNLRDLPLADARPDPILEREAWHDE